MSPESEVGCREQGLMDVGKAGAIGTEHQRQGTLKAGGLGGWGGVWGWKETDRGAGLTTVCHRHAHVSLL